MREHKFHKNDLVRVHESARYELQSISGKYGVVREAGHKKENPDQDDEGICDYVRVTWLGDSPHGFTHEHKIYRGSYFWENIEVKATLE